MQIGVAILPGFKAAALGAVIDVFGTANQLRPSIGPGITTFDVVTIGASKSIQASDRRFAIRTEQPMSSLGSFDLTLVVGTAATSMDELEVAMNAPAARQLIRQLGRNCQTSRLAAACTSTFFVAEAGLLDGHRAATSWWLALDFVRRYPAVTLETNAMVVNDKLLTTAGAALAHLDLALSLVGSQSRHLAEVTAKFLLIDERPSQSAYAAISHLSIADELCREFERHIRGHLDQPVDIGEVARKLGVNRKTLERRIHDAFGKSPLSVVQHIRLEHANHLRLTTNYTQEAIAAKVGYQNSSTLRRLMGPARSRR
jgi:transcriptional regulator GlxA family with amidase domain